MKSKPIILTILILGALAFAVAVWWPTPAEVQIPIVDEHSNQGKEEHPEEERVQTADEHDALRKQETGRDDHGEQEEARAGEEEDAHAGEVVRLNETEIKEFGIEIDTAAVGLLDQYAELPGEIVLNSDRLAHVVPRVSGIVRQVDKSVGDQVNSGERLAVLESRELAEAKAAYLGAVEREELARINFEREELLWQKKVTSEQEYLNARQARSEARIVRTSVEQQLHALGCSEQDLAALPGKTDLAYTHYTLSAPFSGTLIEKHITLGENVATDTEVFTIADLSTVWVDINVYQKDLVLIRKGQSVVIEIGHGIPAASGKIAWVGPLVGEATRTAKARVILANPDGTLRPGLFVTAKVAVSSTAAGIVVPKSALQSFEGRNVVFVQDEDGFEPRPVETGRENATQVEILSGLQAGQRYVSQGAFTLKAQLSKGAFGDGHNH